MYWFYFTENLSKKFGTQINELWDNFGSDFTYPGNLPAYVEEYFEDQEKQQNDLPPGRIQCLPAPGNTTTDKFDCRTGSKKRYPFKSNNKDFAIELLYIKCLTISTKTNNKFLLFIEYEYQSMVLL